MRSALNFWSWSANVLLQITTMRQELTQVSAAPTSFRLLSFSRPAHTQRITATVATARPAMHKMPAGGGGKDAEKAKIVVRICVSVCTPWRPIHRLRSSSSICHCGRMPNKQDMGGRAPVPSGAAVTFPLPLTFFFQHFVGVLDGQCSHTAARCHGPEDHHKADGLPHHLYRVPHGDAPKPPNPAIPPPKKHDRVSLDSI